MPSPSLLAGPESLRRAIEHTLAQKRCDRCGAELPARALWFTGEGKRLCEGCREEDLTEQNRGVQRSPAGTVAVEHETLASGETCYG